MFAAWRKEGLVDAGCIAGCSTRDIMMNRQACAQLTIAAILRSLRPMMTIILPPVGVRLLLQAFSRAVHDQAHRCVALQRTLASLTEQRQLAVPVFILFEFWDCRRFGTASELVPFPGFKRFVPQGTQHNSYTGPACFCKPPKFVHFQLSEEIVNRMASDTDTVVKVLFPH